MDPGQEITPSICKIPGHLEIAINVVTPRMQFRMAPKMETSLPKPTAHLQVWSVGQRMQTTMRRKNHGPEAFGVGVAADAGATALTGACRGTAWRGRSQLHHREKHQQEPRGDRGRTPGVSARQKPPPAYLNSSAKVDAVTKITPRICEFP